MPSCFVICSFKRLILPSYGSYIQPIFDLVQFSEGSSVWSQFLDFVGSQFLLFDLPFNTVTEFFAQCLPVIIAMRAGARRAPKR